MTKEHVIQRAKERLNLNLTEWDCDCLSKMVQDGECEPIKRGIFAVRYRNSIFKVAYSNRKHEVTTIMALN